MRLMKTGETLSSNTEYVKNRNCYEGRMQQDVYYHLRQYNVIIFFHKKRMTLLNSWVVAQISFFLSSLPSFLDCWQYFLKPSAPKIHIEMPFLAFHVDFYDDVFCLHCQKQEPLQSHFQSHGTIFSLSFVESMLLFLFIFHLSLKHYLYQIMTTALRMTIYPKDKQIYFEQVVIQSTKMGSNNSNTEWLNPPLPPCFKLTKCSLSLSVHGPTLSEIRPIFLVIFCASPQLVMPMNSKIMYKKNEWKYIRTRRWSLPICCPYAHGNSPFENKWHILTGEKSFSLHSISVAFS